MQDLLWFLPAWPPQFDEPMAFGALLLAGLVGGEIVNRVLALPRITGYVLAGIACGPFGLGLVEGPLFNEARLFVDLALGLIMFELGARLDFAWLRAQPLAVGGGDRREPGRILRHLPGAAARRVSRRSSPRCAAAVGTATSPAVVMLVTQELRASGQITERMLLFTAVNCAVAFVALTLLLPLVHLEYRADWRSALLHPLYVLFGAALLGFAACQLMLWLPKWLGKRDDRQFVLQVGMIVLVVGLARAADVTVGVALLAFGVFARNQDFDHALLPLRFGYAGQLLFVVLFVLDRGEPRLRLPGTGGGRRRGVHRGALSRQGGGDPRLRPALGPARRRRRPAVAVAAADVGPRGGDGVGHRGAVPGLRHRARRGGAVGGGHPGTDRTARHAVRAAPRGRGERGGARVDALPFTPSAPLSLGVELELQLVRAHDYDLAHDAGDLIARLAKRKVPGAVKPEVTLSMVELNSSIQQGYAGLLAELEAQRAAVREAAGMLNLRVAGGGTHPFHKWPERRVFPEQRFQARDASATASSPSSSPCSASTSTSAARAATTRCISRTCSRATCRSSSRSSAASPFYQGEDTSFQSSRLTAVSAFPLVGPHALRARLAGVRGLFRDHARRSASSRA